MDAYKTDDEQAEMIKQWLRNNGLSLVTGLMLGVAVLYGIKSWGEFGARKAEAASNLYLQFQMAGVKGLDEASGAYEVLIKDHSDSEYAVLAALQMAKLQMSKGDAIAAKAQLQWAMDNAKSDGIKQIAQLRSVRLQLVAGEVDAADKLIAGITDASFAALLEELRGDIALARGKMNEAHAAYQLALDAIPEDAPGRALLEAKRDDTMRSPAEEKKL